MYNIATMEELKIKHKTYQVNEIISDNVFKCTFKNKEYLVYKYEPKSDEFTKKAFVFKKLHESGINTPKLVAIDKKSGCIVREFVSGISMFDYILDNDFNEDIYKKIFLNSYMARIAGLNLNYDLSEWLLVDTELYYVGVYVDKYNPNYDFTKSDIKKWFFTKDLAKYYEKNGVLFDKSRIKEERAVNKEMVLMTCKYYL